jgi:hypothetical protein
MISFPILEAEGLDEAFAPFLDFLQVASTQPSEVTGHPVTIQDHLGLRGHPIRPSVVKMRWNTVLYSLLPDLRPTVGALPDAFTISMSA